MLRCCTQPLALNRSTIAAGGTNLATSATQGVSEEAPQPQPEHREPRLLDPGLTDLSAADWRAAVVRAGRESLDDNIPMIASALAYSAFFAIPSVLLVVLGVFTLIADPATVSELVNRLSSIAPADAANLFGDSIVRLTESAIDQSAAHRCRSRARCLGDDERDDDLHDGAQPRLRAA